jgi:translation elongation factor P/translation initiation factor 5A
MYLFHQAKVSVVIDVSRSSQGAQRSTLIMIDMKDFKTGRKENCRFERSDSVTVVGFDSLQVCLT